MTEHRKAKTGKGKPNLTNRYRLTFGRRGGATVAGSMGRQLQGIGKDGHASQFDDLAMVLDDADNEDNLKS